MMNRLCKALRIPALALALLGLGSTLSAGQTGDNTGMRYDVNTEVTLDGTVEGVMQVPGTGPMSGTHLSLRTTTETIHVHLGPTTFVAKQALKLAKGDVVSVTGSRIKGEGFEAILARIVRHGDGVMTLREIDGKPRWSTGG